MSRTFGKPEIRSDRSLAPTLSLCIHTIRQDAIHPAHVSEYSVLNNYSPSPFTHSCTSASSTLDRNLIPSCQSPVPAISANSCPLSPSPEDAEVANGITVLPVKSLFSIKESTGHAAIPHQIGY